MIIRKMWVYFKGIKNVNCKGNLQENRRYTSFGSATLMIALYRMQVREEEAFRETKACAIDVKLT